MASKKVAIVKCVGDRRVAKEKYEYLGYESCEAAVMHFNGPKECYFGCIGLGDCVEACPFDAMYMSEFALPVVIEDKCIGCGECVKACPKGIMELIDRDQKVYVKCSSHEPAKVTNQVCNNGKKGDEKLGGCIACGLCEKNCPHDAIHVIDNLAVIDYEKCTSCGICVQKCPTNVIIDMLPSRPKAYIGPNCVGCGLCKKVCPTNAISGELKEKHVVDPDKCIGCGECIEACPPKIKAISFIGSYDEIDK